MITITATIQATELDPDAAAVAAGVSFGVGDALETDVGATVGTGVGEALGTEVGAPEVPDVGAAVGADVVAAVGPGVGVGVRAGFTVTKAVVEVTVAGMLALSVT